MQMAFFDRFPFASQLPQQLPQLLARKGAVQCFLAILDSPLGMAQAFDRSSLKESPFLADQRIDQLTIFNQ
jgi:hypothetical protein